MLKAITKIRLTNVEPDAVVMHPNDWQNVATLTTADGVYIWGSPAHRTRPSIRGLPVITSTAMTENTPLVGAFGAGATVYERESVRVSFSESGISDVAGEDLYTKNEIRFRAESRIGLGVLRPDGFCVVTGI